ILYNPKLDLLFAKDIFSLVRIVCFLPYIGFNTPGFLILAIVNSSCFFPYIGWLSLIKNLFFIFSIASIVCLYPSDEVASFLLLYRFSKGKLFITSVSISVNI